MARWTAGVGDQVLAAIATEQAAIAAEVARADGKYVATAGLDAATAPLVTGNGTTAGALRAAFVPVPTGGSDGNALVKSGSTVIWGAASGGSTVTDNGDGTATA